MADEVKQLSLFDAVEIPLTKGYTAIVDPVDADLLDYRWRAFTSRSSGPYAVRGPGAKIAMHRIILERKIGRSLAKGEVTDHADRNTLNNTRSNLRVASYSQNMQNRKRRANSTSGLKGITRHNRTNRWQAQITVNGRSIHLGHYDTPEAAHAAYCEAAHQYFGEFAREE